MQTVLKLVTTVFFLGYLPLVPGTFGSLAGLAVFLLARGDVRWVAAWAVVTLALGFALSGKAERVFGEKDPRYVVIDEVAGMLISLLFVPYDLTLAFIGFLMFRIFDTLKPFPAGQLQDIRGSAGIMLDDIIAGLYALFVLQVIMKFI